MSMALPLCPSNRIEEAFELIQLEVANMSPAVAAFAEEYLNYIRATYMNGNYSTATEGFEWNVYDDIEQGFLTNNPSEGANNRLRTRARVDHPGIYRFCELMRHNQTTNWTTCGLIWLAIDRISRYLDFKSSFKLIFLRVQTTTWNTRPS